MQMVEQLGQAIISVCVVSHRSVCGACVACGLARGVGARVWKAEQLVRAVVSVRRAGRGVRARARRHVAHASGRRQKRLGASLSCAPFTPASLTPTRAR